jgi:hypothetical protein
MANGENGCNYPKHSGRGRPHHRDEGATPSLTNQCEGLPQAPNGRTRNRLPVRLLVADYDEAIIFFTCVQEEQARRGRWQVIADDVDDLREILKTLCRPN